MSSVWYAGVFTGELLCDTCPLIPLCNFGVLGADEDRWVYVYADADVCICMPLSAYINRLGGSSSFPSPSPICKSVELNCVSLDLLCPLLTFELLYAAVVYGSDEDDDELFALFILSDEE